MSSNIERKIIIGMIGSSNFLQQIRTAYNPRFLESAMAKRLATWCIDYFDKYGRAPGKHIADIYYQKLQNGLPTDLGEEIEQEILPSLNDEFLSEFNEEYLIDETFNYFTKRHLEIHRDKIAGLLEDDDIETAQKEVNSFTPIAKKTGDSINFSDSIVLKEIQKAFKEIGDCLIHYPKQLGEFWNHQLIRGGFVALLAPEKRGKSFILMDMARRAVTQGRNVAFFQAGDMTQSQQLRRFCINLAKKSDLERYCGEQWQPTRDCIFNQINQCDKKVRECDFGIFEEKDAQWVREECTFTDLTQAYEEEKDYRPCHNCLEYTKNQWGAIWLEKINVKGPLDEMEAIRIFEKHYVTTKRNLMLSTHANGTLSVQHIRAELNAWKKQNFSSDVIIIDYADLLITQPKTEFRHQQNEIWKMLRSLSQEFNALVITVTQADADSYGRNLLSLKNFSEDKRKYAHVTAMYGLNQDPQGREKRLGILRINELLLREGEFDTQKCIYVLQNLKRGQPIIGSYY